MTRSEGVGYICGICKKQFDSDIRPPKLELIFGEREHRWGRPLCRDCFGKEIERLHIEIE